MALLLDLLTALLCVILAWQDLRSRKVSLLIILLLFVSLSTSSVLVNSFTTAASVFIVNFLLTAIYLLALFGWFAIRKKKLINIFDSFLGLGDALFLICLCAAFSGPNFIAFITISLLLTLVSTFAIAAADKLVPQLVKKAQNPHIPLVTYLGTFYIILLIFKHMNPGFDPYDEAWLLSNFYE